MKRLGQHFLKPFSSVAKKIVQELSIDTVSTIVEIGPGHGELTKEIQKQHPNTNLLLIEKDHSLILGLQEQFTTARIIQADALNILPSIVDELHIDNYILLGNIPYYISGHLFRIIGELSVKPKQCIFTIQKEVADRLCAQPPSMNRLAAMVQFWAMPEIIMRLKPEDFTPAPRVKSTVIKLTPHLQKQTVSQESYETVASFLFRQPRKTILNNLTFAFENLNWLPNKLSKADLRNFCEKTLENLGFFPTTRPQNLRVEDIITITEAFAKLS